MEHVEYCEDDSSNLVLEDGGQVTSGGSLTLLLEVGEEGAGEFNCCSVRDVLDLWTYAILIVSWRAVRRSLSLVMWAVLAEEIARVLLTAGLIDCR